MEHKCIETGQKKSLNMFSNDVREKISLEYFQSKSSSLTSSSCPKCQLTLSINQYLRNLRSNRELVPGHSRYRSNSRISKRITSVNQQYLNHCLELIQISVAKAASSNISQTLRTSKTRCSTETFSSPGNVSLVDSLPAGLVDVVLSPLKAWIPGSETRSKNMIDITCSPLFRPARATNDINCLEGSLGSYHYGSPGGFSALSSPLAKGDPEKQKYGSDDVRNRDRSAYTSSILSTSSDLSLCASTLVSHGMLQCTWTNGAPHFMFSTDNKPNVYMTRPSKSATSDHNSLDWTYLIHLRTSDMKDSDLVGRINVSTQYRICGDSSKIMETESVLYGSDTNQEAELTNLSPDMEKHRKFPQKQKVCKFFKPCHSPKHRLDTKMCGTSTFIEPPPPKPGQDEEEGDSDDTKCLNLLENNIASNFELAAIVVKEHIQTLQAEKAEVSGWGMSFLKRAKDKQATDCHPSTLETSMDILVPAGHHGGPTTQNRGPSSLIERWKTGGQCDCCGWDTGCPITVLNAIPNKDYSKSFNLFVKGDEEGGVPSMKMVNAQKGLYSIEFQTRLSALQCFSIAVAVIHSRCPTLRPEG